MQIFPVTITKNSPKFPMYNYLNAKNYQINLPLAKKLIRRWKTDQDINKLPFFSYLWKDSPEGNLFHSTNILGWKLHLVPLCLLTYTSVCKNLTTRCQNAQRYRAQHYRAPPVHTVDAMLYRSISIQSPTWSRLSGTQAHAEQININLMAWFPQVLFFPRIIKVRKRNWISVFPQNQQQFRASIKVFVNLRSLWCIFIT